MTNLAVLSNPDFLKCPTCKNELSITTEATLKCGTCGVVSSGEATIKKIIRGNLDSMETAFYQAPKLPEFLAKQERRKTLREQIQRKKDERNGCIARGEIATPTKTNDEQTNPNPDAKSIWKGLAASGLSKDAMADIIYNGFTPEKLESAMSQLTLETPNHGTTCLITHCTTIQNEEETTLDRSSIVPIE